MFMSNLLSDVVVCLGDKIHQFGVAVGPVLDEALKLRIEVLELGSLGGFLRIFSREPKLRKQAKLQRLLSTSHIFFQFLDFGLSEHHFERLWEFSPDSVSCGT